MSSAVTRVVTTPVGPARVRLHEAPPRTRRGLLVLGHGAGGGVDAPDLLAVTAAAGAIGWSVALLEQPYRVAGRRAPAPAAQLDLAWTAVVATLRRRRGVLPVAAGGRSSGARVACRTAGATGVVAVVALAFPLHPPTRPQVSRADELRLPVVPVLVVQGDRDPFGDAAAVAAAAPVEVVGVRGDHSLRTSAMEVGARVARWLDQLVA